MIEVRAARLDDVPFIRQLTIETVTMGVPEGRDIPNEAVTAHATAALQNLELLLLQKQRASVLLAVDRLETGQEKPVGFLILEFDHVEESTGEKQTFVNNIAVTPEYWGRYVAQKLLREATSLSHARGYRYMTCNISTSNQRSLQTGLRFGFQIERYQLTLATGADGPQPMPGRKAEERSHDQSRRSRRPPKG